MEPRLVLTCTDGKEMECPSSIAKRCSTLKDAMEADLPRSNPDYVHLQVPFRSKDVKIWLEWMQKFEKERDVWNPSPKRKEDWMCFCWISFYLHEEEARNKVTKLMVDQSQKNEKFHLPEFHHNDPERDKKRRHLDSLRSMLTAIDH